MLIPVPPEVVAIGAPFQKALLTLPPLRLSEAKVTFEVVATSCPMAMVTPPVPLPVVVTPVPCNMEAVLVG